jgi:hypothetical protein
MWSGPLGVVVLVIILVPDSLIWSCALLGQCRYPGVPMSETRATSSGTRRIKRLTKLLLAQSWSVVPSIWTVAATTEGTHALCHFRMRAGAQQDAFTEGLGLFDHLGGACEEGDGHGEAERVGGFEVDDQLIFGRCLHR